VKCTASAIARRFRFLNWANAIPVEFVAQRQQGRFDEASEGRSEEVRNFCTPRANFRLTGFFGDFRLNHQLTKTHKYAQRVLEVWKTCQNGAVTICYLWPMLTREIQLDTNGGPVTLNPRWLRIPGAVKYSGLSRSKLYELLSEGRIRSICVKSQKWAQRGVRLIDRESIDLFMEGQEPA
jgi:hypothetical protein